jgi:type IV pilus assembly protein PilM
MNLKMQLARIFKKETKDILSLDFGRIVKKIAYLRAAGDGSFRLLGYDLRKISPDEKWKEETVNFVSDFLKTNSPATKEACLTISDPDSVVIKNVVLPEVPREEILQAIKWQFQEEPSLDFEDSVFDWRVVKEYTDEDGAKKKQIIFTSIKNETMDKYLSIVRRCNLSLSGVSSAPFNYANILRCLDSGIQAQDRVVAVLDIGHTDSTLCIYNHNKLNFVRKVVFSSERLTATLTDTLVSDKGEITLSYEKAESIKEAFGIIQDEGMVLEGNIQARSVISLMRPLLEGLVRELRYSVNYYITNFKEEGVSILYITGGGANLKNLTGYLNKELNIEVSLLSLPACIDAQGIDKERLDREHNQIISSVGAVLLDPETINLIPAEVKFQKIELIEKISLRLVAFTLGCVLLFSFFTAGLKIRNYENRLANAQAYLTTMGEIRVLEQKVNPLENLLYKVQEGRMPAGGLLKLTSALLPNNAELDGLSLDQEGFTLALKGKIDLRQNNAPGQAQKFAARLKASAFFSEARLVSVRENGEYEEFEIECKLAY